MRRKRGRHGGRLGVVDVVEVGGALLSVVLDTSSSRSSYSGVAITTRGTERIFI